MQRKFTVVIFYENEEVLKKYLSSSFTFDDPLIIKTTSYNNETYYEYDHFIVKCFKSFPYDRYRGHKCDLVAVEYNLTLIERDEWVRCINTVIPCMLTGQKFKMCVQIFY